MSTTLMQQTTFDTTSPVRPSANIASGPSANIASITFENIDGPVVYHKNPVGANHIFKGKQGRIVGYENKGKKRAIVAWDGIKEQRSVNTTSLCSSPSKNKTRKKSKKRKRVIVATVVRKKITFNNSSVSNNRNPETCYNSDMSSPTSSSSSSASSSSTASSADDEAGDSWLDMFYFSSPIKKTHSP